MLAVHRYEPMASRIIRIVEWTTSTVLASLEGDDRLLGWLTALGIVVFIIGNALQFAATFHPQ
jgi:hypothetical protein